MFINFEASEALYDDNGPLANTNQAAYVKLFVIPDENGDFVQLTYDCLRIAPNGDNVAGFSEGLWKLSLDSLNSIYNIKIIEVKTLNGNVVSQLPLEDMIFSDVVIHP